MIVPHLGDFGRGGHGGHHGGHRGRGRGWGGGWGYGPWWYQGYEAEPPENKYVILDSSGKAIAVVRGIPQVPAGYSFRIATPAEAALNLPSALSGMGQAVVRNRNTGETVMVLPSKGTRTLADYIVRGPEGEVYGRYQTMPSPSQIPLYAIAEEEKPGWLGGNSIF